MRRDDDGQTAQVEERIAALGRLDIPASVRAELLDLAVSAEAASMWESVERTRMSAKPKPRGATRRSRWWVGGLIVAIGAGVAVPAAAVTSWFARTGEMGSPATGTEEDASEWIDLGAPDAPDVVVDAYPAYLTLPDSTSPDDAIRDAARILGRLNSDAGERGVAQESLITQTYETFAVCAWTVEWLDAESVSEHNRMLEAVDWMKNTENYRVLASNDGGGVVDAIQGFAASAEGGDVSQVEKGYRAFACDGRVERTTR